MERLGVAVEQMLESTGASRRHIGRVLGREVNRVIPNLLAGNDCYLSTLIDLAEATQHEVVISFRKKS